MSEVTIKTDDLKPEATKVDREDIKDTLKRADEYEKLKERNDKFEAEIQRTEELKAKMALGGRAQAGQAEESQEDKDEKEATELLSTYR